MTSLFVLVLALGGCGGEEPPPPATPAEAPSAAAQAPAVAAAPASAAPRVPTSSTARMAASHVLVTYTGAVNALPNITRSKDEARTRAEEARARILAGEDFSEVAKLYSDDSTGPRGGSLGGFGKDTMVAPFEAALTALQVGEVSGLVETPFGFHVIRRDAVLELHAKHLVVTWAGAERAPAGIGRSKEEARARIEEVKAQLAAGEPWDEVARRYSDDPLKEFGGDLGWFARGQLAPALDTVAFDLDIGATSDILETPLGFHLLYRVE